MAFRRRCRPLQWLGSVLGMRDVMIQPSFGGRKIDSSVLHSLVRDLSTHWMARWSRNRPHLAGRKAKSAQVAFHPWRDWESERGRDAMHRSGKDAERHGGARDGSLRTSTDSPLSDFHSFSGTWEVSLFLFHSIHPCLEIIRSSRSGGARVGPPRITYLQRTGSRRRILSSTCTVFFSTYGLL